jgi:hypothetical protein
MQHRSAAALLVLLALVGCGGDENTFSQDYNRAVRPLSRLGNHIGTRPSSFDALARRTRETRANLAKLEAPNGAQDEMRALLARLDAVTADLRDVATAARRSDVVKQRRAARALVRSSNAVEKAETRLKRAVEGAG